MAVCAGAAAGQRRYAAVDMSPAGGGGGLVPRFFIDEPRLVARDGAPCPANAHSCETPANHPETKTINGEAGSDRLRCDIGLDIGFPDQCCSNENYCYVKPNGNPWCCQIGSNCDSKCSASQFQCTNVVTVTITPTSNGNPTVTSSTGSACCYRGCPSTSNFRCADRFGGGCCPYGNTCASSKQCIQTISATPSSTAGGLTPADPGCTATTQHACADGQGCCDDLMHCTSVSGTAACAPGNPTATDVTYDPNSSGGSGGLSAGAKAGIGVGVSVVGLALVGVLAWFCLVRRRRRRGATTMTASSQRSGGGGGGGGLSNVIGGGAASSRPGRSARAMSEVTSGSRPTARRGATQDYFGPDAVAGPYTETETVASAEGAATVASSPGRHRGVPLQAHSPSDVVAPVEIDSRVKRGAPAAVTSVSQQALAPSSPPTTEGRFELYGSEMPSPTSPGMPSPPLMTPSARSVSMMERSPIDRSPGPAPSPEPRRR
ncbi:hypothetical protein GCG54_00012030 [Colletotrichum gloeosporioides]|uniref:Mid2 domain-containing protein n=1 Tax=Colletotrichum gloeosporioides TaxID=474922 RepID=A0A8H4FMJ2_COLGL|nr:uncharacterized protein GCG54_00012030 [Colletotrichum gloeosporioides]KAF3807632.1 hypothetical protein GCG54_00012030 [Colletotrichum gloeosporioides]